MIQSLDGWLARARKGSFGCIALHGVIMMVIIIVIVTVIVMVIVIVNDLYLVA